MCYWSVSKAAQFAKKQTAKAASVKAWRITTKAGRALQEEARRLSAGRGYIIATDAEIFAKYGELWALVLYLPFAFGMLVNDVQQSRQRAKRRE